GRRRRPAFERGAGRGGGGGPPGSRPCLSLEVETMSRGTRRVFNCPAATWARAGPPPPSVPARGRAQTHQLKAGALLPRAVAPAFIGQSCQRGADIAPGMLRDMYGVDIELMNADIESNVDVARSRAEKLIDDGAQVLVGAFDSGPTAAIAQV